MKTIRMALRSDGPSLADIYRPSVDGSAVSFELEAPSAAEMARRVEAVTRTTPWLVGEAAGTVIGYAYASKHREREAYRWSVDVSVYIREGHRRSGVGRALYLSLFELLRLQGYCAAHAGITLPNPGSVGLHESLGFRRVGVYPRVGFKCGAWHDVGWWQLELRDRTGAAPAILSMEELRASPGFAAALAAGA